MASSRRWSALELDALRRVTLWVGERQIPLNQAPAEPVSLAQRDLYSLNLRFPAGELDAGALELQVDYDPDLGGVPIRFYTADTGLRVVEQESMVQMAGQRFIGDSVVVLSYRGDAVPFALTAIRFQPEEGVQEQYEYMRKALQAQNALILDFHGLAHIWSEWDSEGDGSAPANLELFELVRWGYGRIFPVLRRIALEPIKDLVVAPERQELHRARRFTGAALRRAATDGTPWAQVALAELPQVAALPAAIWVEEERVTYANAENGFVREFVTALVFHAQQLQASSAKEAERLRQLTAERYGPWRTQTELQLTRVQRSLGLMKSIEASLNGLLEEPFLQHRRPVPGGPPSHRLLGNPLYRTVWRTAQQFRWGLRLSDQLVNVDALPMRTRSINTLYEYWLAATVLHVLVDRLGFQPVRRNGRLIEVDQSALNAVMTQGTATDLQLPEGVTCRVRYGYRYPLLRQSQVAVLGVEPKVLDGQLQKKDCPDLALEFYRPGQSIPAIVTLDATYTYNPELLQKKFYYLETIRARSGPNLPESEWAYPVCEAWAVYPGQTRTVPRRRGFVGGEFGLVPGPAAEEDLTEFLRGIVSRIP